MESISPRPAAGALDLKQELFLRAEELERLLAIYKHKLCTDEMSSLINGSELMESRNSYAGDFSGDQRGQFYDIYMQKREVKLKEEWRTRGAEKDAEMRAMMENLESSCSMMKSRDKGTEPKNYHTRQTHSRKLSSSSTVSSSTSSNSPTSAPIPTTRPSNPPSLRKENTKPTTGVSKAATLQKSTARSQSSSERIGLLKDMKARRSLSLRKNSASLGDQKDFMYLNSDRANLAPTMRRNAPRSDPSKPLLRQSNTIDPSARVIARSSIEMQKEGAAEYWDSAFHRFESKDLPFGLHESSDVNRNLEGKTVRARKKWGDVERPFPTSDASNHSRMDLSKGIKNFLKFGKRNRGMEIDNGHDSVNYSVKDLRMLRMGQSPSFDSSNEDETLRAQGARALFRLPAFHHRDTKTKS